MPLLLTLVMCSCSSEDDGCDSGSGSPIAIVSQDLTFGPKAGTGTLEFQCDGAVMASLVSDWCTATMEGNKVKVSVVDNTDIEGRVAILTLNSEDYSVKIPVQQRGMALATLPIYNYHAENAGAKKSFVIQHDFDVKLTTEDDWIHPVMDGDTLKITIDPNETAQIRRGSMEFACAGVVDTLNIVQYDLKENVIGTYYFGGNYAGSPYGISFEFYQKDGQFYTDWSSHKGWETAVFPAKFDAERCAITIPSYMEYFYNNGDYERGLFYDTSGIVAMSNTVGMVSYLYSNPLFYNASYGTLEDDGSWPGHTLSGFVIRKSVLQGLLVQTLVNLTDLYILRVGPLGVLDESNE